MRLSWPYPPAKEGYWHPITSTINWCEEDYYFTSYSAEIVNTLTNLLFIFLGIKGLRNCLKYDHDRVFVVAFAGYLMVGSGSFAFHSTLKYPMQLVDELSMIYTACLMCYATFSFSQSPPVRWALSIGLSSLAIFITLYYHYLQDPLFHQNAFAIITAVVLFRSMYVMEVNIRPSLRKRWATVPLKRAPDSQEEQQANAVRNEKIIKEMWLMVAMGLSIFLGGFAIWNLDNQYCPTIRVWRKQVGLPWGILLEGHGWWHLMTGVGSYFYIVWAIWLRHCLNERQDEYVLYWPNIWTLPEVVPLPEAQRHSAAQKYMNGNGDVNGNGIGSDYSNGNGYTNGHAKREDRKSR